MIIAFRVMPVDGETEYSDLEKAVKETVEAYAEDVKIKECVSEPAGFGMQAVAIEIQMDEKHGSEDLENQLNDLEITGDISVTKMDRL